MGVCVLEECNRLMSESAHVVKLVSQVIHTFIHAPLKKNGLLVPESSANANYTLILSKCQNMKTLKIFSECRYLLILCDLLFLFIIFSLSRLEFSLLFPTSFQSHSFFCLVGHRNICGHHSLP